MEQSGRLTVFEMHESFELTLCVIIDENLYL